MEIVFNSIGRINTPFKTIEDMPIQPSGARGILGTVEVFPEFTPALKDLEGFSHIYLLYYFHRVKEWKPQVIPFLDNSPHGVLSTRAPKRPNPIGLSIVHLLSIEDGLLKVENIDVLDGTPLLDIKPYVPGFDHFEATSIGWLEKNIKQVRDQRSDQRFR